MPRRFSVASFWDWVTKYRCTWFALVPSIISHLLTWTDPYAEGKGAGLEQVRFACSSSSPLPPFLHRAFEDKFRLTLIELLGSTEAGGLIFSNPLPPGERKIGSPGLPCGFDVKIVNAEGCELPSGRTGEIVLRGPSVMKGYYRDSEATAKVISSDGWFHTGDLGYKDKDGYFSVVGRAKELIIKGGENIAPREIDEALARYPGVMEAAVVGVPDPYLGEDIVAYVVLKAGKRSNEQDLLSFCRHELGSFKTPSKIFFVDALPKGPSGKVQRFKLVEQAEKNAKCGISVACGDLGIGDLEEIGRKLGVVTPRTSVEEVLAGIWAEVLSLNHVGIHDNFFHLGGHSVLATQVISRVINIFRVELPLRSLFEAPTVARMAVVITLNQAKKARPEDLARMLTELEALSDEEAQRLLADENT